MEITVRGSLVKVASVRDEDFHCGIDLASFSGAKADIIEFAQKMPDTQPRLSYTFEWDNVAAIPTASFNDWWNSAARQLKQNVRRAEKSGVKVREVELDDQLVHGIVEIYNETPVRQGRHFRGYGKDFNQLKKEMQRFPERSRFLGAYLGAELIGFMKIVEVGGVGRVLHIVSKTSQHEKRPTNALIAKAVKLCAQHGWSHLLYGKYVYASGPNSLTDFKHRNGFVPIQVPRYFIPLTLKGRVCLRLKMHRGFKSLIPESIMLLMRKVRGWYYLKMTENNCGH